MPSSSSSWTRAGIPSQSLSPSFVSNGTALFWLNPVKDGYMCRLRIPGGVVKSYQLREIAAIARELTTGYIQITTRNNFQIRLIEPKNCPEVLRRIQGCGLHSKGAGADNIRNITMNPCAGYDPMRSSTCVRS
jgi:ferredoxin-nitrite reductase